MNPIIRCGVLLWLLSVSGWLTALAQPPAIAAAGVVDTASADAEARAEQLSRDWSGRAVREAIGLYDNLIEHHRRQGDERRASVMEFKAALLDFLLEDYDSAVRRARNVSRQARLDGDDSVTVEALALLTLASMQQGRIEKSERSLGQAFAMLEAVESPAARGALYFAAAELRYNQRRLDEAVDLGIRAAEQYRAAGDARRESEALRSLSFAHSGRDEFRIARTKLEEALAISERIGDRRGAALAGFQTAYFHLVFNEPQQAMRKLHEAAAHFPDDMDYINRARLHNGLSTLYEIYGDWNAALVNRQKTLAFYEKGNYPLGQLAAMPSLIDINFKLGDESAAFGFQRRAEEMARRLKNDFYLAKANSYVADYFRRKDFDRALIFYRKVLAQFTRLRYADGIAAIHNSLGESYLERHELAVARRHFELSLAISRRNSDRMAEARTLQNLAELAQAAGDDSAALHNIRESIDITDRLLSDTFHSHLKSAYFSSSHSRYELYIHQLMKRHRNAPDADYAVKALQMAEKARARAMLESLALSGADFTKDADAVTVAREKELLVLINTKANRLSSLLGRNADRHEVVSLTGEINELRHQLETIKSELKQKSPIYSSIKNPPTFDLEDFRRTMLVDETLLLEFSLGETESYLWLVGSDEFSAHVLPPRREIEARVDKIRALLSNREIRDDELLEDYQARIRTVEAELSAEAREMSSILLEPVADRLRGRRLIIVPDGKLHYLPFAALPTPNLDTLLLTTNEIVYGPSAQALTLLAKRRSAMARPKKGAVIFADPVLWANDSRLLAHFGRPEPAEADLRRQELRTVMNGLRPLPASRAEAESIGTIIGNSNIYSGFAATREQLLNLPISDYQIVHFATHGLIDEDRPELSGLALSGFDEYGRNLDWAFRIQDIYGIELNADLVVLSACETAVGKEFKGEGLRSLNNAFLQSGARAVLGSLWKVEDGATLELMKHFYAAMKDDGMRPAEALRRAQIKLRDTPRYRSPFYWAAFTLQGDYDARPQLGESGRPLGWLGLLLVPLALFGLYLRRRRVQSNRT